MHPYVSDAKDVWQHFCNKTKGYINMQQKFAAE